MDPEPKDNKAEGEETKTKEELKLKYQIDLLVKEKNERIERERREQMQKYFEPINGNNQSTAAKIHSRGVFKMIDGLKKVIINIG